MSAPPPSAGQCPWPSGIAFLLFAWVAWFGARACHPTTDISNASSNGSSADDRNVLLPFYVAPESAGRGCVHPAYTRLATSQLTPHAWVVLNANNGPPQPSSSRAQLFLECAQLLRGKGARILGYVSSKITSYQPGTPFAQVALRPITEVSRALYDWKRIGVDGVFLDEVSTVAAPAFGTRQQHHHHYLPIYRRARDIDPAWRLWLNAGGAVPAHYLVGPERVGDGLVAFEGPAAAWRGPCTHYPAGPFCRYQPGDGAGPLIDAIERGQLSETHLAALIYAAPTAEARALMQQGANQGIGVFYLSESNSATFANHPPSAAMLQQLAQTRLRQRQ